MKWLMQITPLLWLGMGLSTVQAQGDAVAGQQKAAVCAACHGADGNSAIAEYPKLAGQHDFYIVKQLQDFKSGARANQLMSPMAMSLSEQDMWDMAAYYATQDIRYHSRRPGAGRGG